MVRLVIALSLTLASATVALARQAPHQHHPDATIMVGLTTGPPAHPAFGVALGGGGSTVRFEIAYAHGRRSLSGLTTIMVDVMVQFAAPVSVLRPYVEGGAGAYGEVVGGGRANTGTGANFGAGVKITLVGPSSLRLDYRAFFLDGHAAHSRPQRVYAGLNVSF